MLKYMFRMLSGVFFGPVALLSNDISYIVTRTDKQYKFIDSVLARSNFGWCLHGYGHNHSTISGLRIFVNDSGI